MSKKYLSTDPDCMAEAARRFYTLFGYYPEYIGAHPGNYEAHARKSIRFPRVKEYIDTLLSQKPEFVFTSPAPPITMQEIPIKAHSAGLDSNNDFILWSYKTGAVKPELVFDVNGYTIIKMLESMGYRCQNFIQGDLGHDLFSLQRNHLYINMALDRTEYQYPEHLKEYLENRVIRKSKEAQKKPENKTVGDLDIKINIDAKKSIEELEGVKRLANECEAAIKQALQPSQHANCKCSKEKSKKPYIKVTIYNGDFTQEMFFDKCSIHTDSNDTTFQASSFKYSVIDPVKE